MASFFAYVLGAALVFTALALLISRRRARAQSARIRSLVETADGLLERPPGSRSPFPGGDEIDALERSLTRGGAELRSRIDQLETEASRREAILSSMGEGVLVVDNDLRVIFSNDAMLRAVGAPRPIRERLPLIELVRDSGVLAIVEDVIRSGENRKQSLRVAAAFGRSFEIYAAPLEAGTGRGAIAIFHDITDLERLDQVRKDFVANVSHEMRTPLASIVAYSDTLLEGALGDAKVNRKFIEVMRSSAIRLTHIANDLLILSDLESGADLGPTERVSVRDVLESTLKTIAPEAREGNITMITASMPTLFVAGHRLRLEQALLNLLANAVKFNRPGGEVRVGAAAGEAGSIQIEVADTGIGIPSQDLPRIFERFYRVDKARSREVGGTGLGLSIAKHAVEAMNGTITVESRLGKGSRFLITLPGAPIA